MILATSLLAPVEQDLNILIENLKKLISARHPILEAAAEHIFTAGGKKIRPAIVLLVSRATMVDQELTQRHRRLAEITEMIHNASLLHDDVLDEAQVRRNVPTANQLFGDGVAILAGDFLFAQASWYLANLDNLAVVKLLSEVIRDFAEGELQQGLSHFDLNLTLESYLEKSYYKSASIIANSAKAAAILSETDDAVAEDMYNYGRALGIAFQIVDDILDFTGSTSELGKPAGSDLASGNLTAPVLYALEEKPKLATLIEREFSEADDLATAINLVRESKGIERSQALALEYAKEAAASLAKLEPSPAAAALNQLTHFVISRSS